MTEFIMVRHGQTKLNYKLVLQGHMHGELDETGVKQSRAAAEEISKMNISVIYSSDLKRAVSTAEYIQKKIGVQLFTDSRLRERNLGIFEGLTLDEIKRKYPGEYKIYTDLYPDPDFIVPEGESIKQMFARLISFLNPIAADNPGKKIAIVTHSGPLDVIFRWVLNIPFDTPRKFKIFNAAISTFYAESNNWILKEWGSVRHLSGTDAIDINV